jgi:hypothetical protein
MFPNLTIKNLRKLFSPAPDYQVKHMETKTAIKTIANYWSVAFPFVPLSELISKIEKVHAEYKEKVTSNIFYKVPNSIDQYDDDSEKFETDPYEYMYDQEVVSMAEEHLEYLKSLPEKVKSRYR